MSKHHLICYVVVSFLCNVGATSQDILAMRYRQGLLHQHGHAGMFYVLSSDSSPQGKLDFMMTLEDRISRIDAEELIACQGDIAKLEDWSSKSKIMTTQLPLGIIGSGNSVLGAKHECIFHQVLGFANVSYES